MSSAVHTEAVAVLVKPETTYLTDAAPVGTDAVEINKPRPQLTLEDIFDGDRGAQLVGFGTIRRAGPQGRSIRGSLRVYIKGNGTAYTSSSVIVPNVHHLLRGSGLVANVTTTGGSERWDFSPHADEVAPTSLTMWFYTRQELIKATGCYCNFRITYEAGMLPVMEFDFVGVVAQTITTGGIGTISGLSYHTDTVQPPAAVGMSFNIGDYTAVKGLRRMVYEHNRELSDVRVDMLAADGHAGWHPGKRAPTLEVDLDATTPLATTPFHAAGGLDPYQLYRSANAFIVGAQVGTVQYNRWALLGGTLGQQWQMIAEPEWLDDGVAARWRLRMRPYVTTPIGANDILFRWF